MKLSENNYDNILKGLKEKIKSARHRTALQVNGALISVYWEIGNIILEEQKNEGWGTKVIDRLAADLKKEFPDMKGLSGRNLKYMRTFAEAYPEFMRMSSSQIGTADINPSAIVQPLVAQLKFPDNQQLTIVQPVVAQIPWTHHTIILDKLKTIEERFFYINKTAENGWSKNVMILQIESNLHQRQGKAITNFSNTLLADDSDLAKEILKNPYVFDFLSFEEEMRERDLERALIQHLKKFMLELGKGFAYMGNQYNLNIENDDYFLDLLFYNTHLHCYVLFELKIGEFKPEFAGKLNFYINTVNEQIKMSEDKPTIGILLCKTPNETVVKYSLQGIETPMGVADYVLANTLPKELKGEIPTIEELEKELDEEVERLEKPADKKMNRLKELLKGLKEEEVREKKSAERAKELFQLVLLRMMNEITDELKKEIVPLFDNFQYRIRTDNHPHETIDSAYKHLSEHPGTYDFEWEFSLNGFRPAGINAFQCSAYIRMYLEDYKYVITEKANRQKNLLEKLYHQLPDDSEFNFIVEKIKENILDEITRQLDRIEKETKQKEKN